MRTSEGTTIWYLRVIHHLAQSGDVWTFDVHGEEWGEVDFPADVEAARELTTRWDSALDKSAAA
jgi:choline kinase